MSRTKLTLDSLQVETFTTSEAASFVLESPTSTFATTGPWFCAAACDPL